MTTPVSPSEEALYRLTFGYQDTRMLYEITAAGIPTGFAAPRITPILTALCRVETVPTP